MRAVDRAIREVRDRLRRIDEAEIAQAVFAGRSAFAIIAAAARRYAIGPQLSYLLRIQLGIAAAVVIVVVAARWGRACRESGEQNDGGADRTKPLPRF